MKSAAPAIEYAPIFNWSPFRSRKVSIISFLAASAVLHLACFYIFQIIYPPTVALLPPPARVSIITPDSEEGRLLLRWIESEDPALSSTTQRTSDPASFAFPKTEHVPSYFTRRPALRELPPPQPDLSVPSSHPPAPVPIAPKTTAPISVATPTTVKFSADTRSLGLPVFPPIDFKASSGEPPHAAQFRVAISAQGEVRHCLLQDSSGDAVLDEAARRYLLLVRFPASTESGTNDEVMTWTTAIFEWGNDVVLPSKVFAP